MDRDVTERLTVVRVRVSLCHSLLEAAFGPRISKLCSIQNQGRIMQLFAGVLLLVSRSSFIKIGVIAAAAILCASAFFLRTSAARGTNSRASSKSDDQQTPWKPSETIDAATLAKTISDSNSANLPVIVCVGFHTLYEGAHIRGASFHGAASTPQGLADLKQWAKPLPRESNIVIYCGCCPLAHCPNVRPAFSALRDMGFTHLRVLILPHDFATDWVQPGYPIAKGK
jgi:thiosulfate/3-mercaptopyruvate sulfurtransferase